MSVHVVKVPDIGEGIAEVELVEWHVQPGDAVVMDQVLADLMTDKATVEVPTPVAGAPAAVAPAAAHAAAAARAPTAETTTPEVVGKPLASPSVRRHARE